jgi:hypothetical protein
VSIILAGELPNISSYAMLPSSRMLGSCEYTRIVQLIVPDASANDRQDLARKITPYSAAGSVHASSISQGLRYAAALQHSWLCLLYVFLKLHEVVLKDKETHCPGSDRLNFGLRNPRLRLLTFRSIDLLVSIPMS